MAIPWKPVVAHALELIETDGNVTSHKKQGRPGSLEGSEDVRIERQSEGRGIQELSDEACKFRV